MKKTILVILIAMLVISSSIIFPTVSAEDTTCSAEWQEDSPVEEGTAIHADFTWTDAFYHPNYQMIAVMSIWDPDGIQRAYYVEEFNLSGSYPLQATADKTGRWTAKITAYKDFNDDVSDTKYLDVESPNNPPNIPSMPSGPSSRDIDESGTYSTSATDPDGDQVKYRFDWGDGDVSGWTNYVSSGASASKSHSWSSSGTYDVKAQAMDENSATSGWSSSLSVNILGVKNPPNIPSMPSGPSSRDIDESGTYITSATDPDGDQVKYRFDWGDGDVSGWTNYVSSGASASKSHSWSSSGNYIVKAQAMDKNDAASGWSSGKTVVIEDVTEPLTADAGEPYYNCGEKTIQFHGDASGGSRPYDWYWDFGDDETSTTQSPSHTYSKAGIYQVTLTVTDSNGETVSDDTIAAIVAQHSKRYAVILTGDDNRLEYQVSMSIAAQRMYDCLKSSKYNFKDSEIYVLSPFDFNPDINIQQGTKQKLKDVLSKMSDANLLFFMYIGHCGKEVGVDGKWFFDLQGEDMTSSQLASYIPSIKGYSVFALNACFSESFISSLSNSKRIVMTSSRMFETTTHYTWTDGWINYFIDGLNGDADDDNNGQVSIEEAFYYAEQKVYRPMNIPNDMGQQPLLDDNGDGKGHSPHVEGNSEYTRIPDDKNKDGFYASITTLNYGLNVNSKSIDKKPLMLSIFERIKMKYPILIKIIEFLNLRI